MLETVLPFITLAIIVGVLTNISIHFFLKNYKRFGLVDKPNGRKVHKKPIPVVGGISMVLALIITVFINEDLRDLVINMWVPFLGALVIALVALIDDKIELSSKLRLVIQVVLAFSLSFSGIRIESFHGLFGIYEIPEVIQYFITIMVVVGTTNAYNLIDGLDGLAGSLSQTTALLFSAMALYMGLEAISLWCFGIAISLMVFLQYNQHPAKIFMGDAGSMTLGFIFSFVAIYLLQSPVENNFTQYRLVLIFAVLSVAVLDAVRVFLKRYSIKKSIFDADKAHLHHLFLYISGNHKKVSRMISVFQFTLLILAMFFVSYFSVTFTIVALVASQIILVKLLNVNKYVSKWKEIIFHYEKELG